ncbi:flagellar assembly protein T N-terminal domain-containing protein [Thalassotalea sp. 1_MG-2023]|uniref:flagella assembly protein FlgT n=1 Tax=Thalassotalea sp. 1_MG-2023 TaxID=3062680 RepID=UPI0026E3C6C9|nr:flagella assembly protein FlgT [Thalassotalea sp. 1_MG-2023]MDO6426423.1 flagellar assembly protein T N-terminal domain-containing protein [Thalassotalea sp. 1_MG-2023]
MQRLSFVILCLFLLVSPTYAQWYESQGHAYVIQGDSIEARKKAIENALKKALLVAGASVSSVQQVVNGLLTQNEINIRATGNINAFEIIDETHEDKTITVTIRADIIPQTRQCFSADYRKSMLITKSHLVHREQANIGGIYSLDSAIMKRLSDQIKQNGTYLSPQLSVKSSSAFSRYNNSLQLDKIKAVSMSLANITDSQYVMYSEIEDVSFATQAENSWAFWQEDIFERFFQLTVHIYNGANGERLFEKTYRNAAPWTFNKREQVDPHSQVFWQSRYGQIIDQALNQVSTDIDDNMMCQPTRGKIVQVNADQVRFNLGKQHGVQIGDEFSLLHLKNFTTDSGHSYAGFNVSPFNVKVIRVSQSSAVAQTTDGALIDSIQINDLVVRY